MSTPAFVKRILRSNAFQTFISYPLAGYFQFVTWTGKIDRPEPPVPGPFIMAMWHGRLIMLPMLRVGDRGAGVLGRRSSRTRSRPLWAVWQNPRQRCGSRRRSPCAKQRRWP